MKILKTYIFREIIPNFFVGLIFLTIIMTSIEIMKLVRSMIEKGVPFDDTLNLFIYVVPNVLYFTFPASILFGVILALGRFSGDSEIVSMRASGLGLSKIFTILALFGIIATFIHLAYYEYVLPYTSRKYVLTWQKVIKANPIIKLIDEERYQDLRLRADNYDLKNKTLEKVRIENYKLKQHYFAERAKFDKKDEEKNAYPLILEDVIIQPLLFIEKTNRQKDRVKEQLGQSPDSEGELFEERYVKEMIIYIEDISSAIDISDRPNTMSITDLGEKISKKKKQLALEAINKIHYNIRYYQKLYQLDKSLFNQNLENEKTLLQLIEQIANTESRSGAGKQDKTNSNEDKFQNKKYDEKTVRNVINTLKIVKNMNKEIDHILSGKREFTNYELYWFNLKFSIPLACLAFSIIALPFGVFHRKEGKILGLGIAVLIILLWYFFLNLGLISFKIRILDAITASWLHLLVLLEVGLFLIIRKLDIN